MAILSAPDASGNATEVDDHHVIGFIPRDADCSRARHGVMHGLAAHFPGTIAPDDLLFGLSAGPDRSIPITCVSAQVDDALTELAFQWIRGFFCGFLYREGGAV